MVSELRMLFEVVAIQTNF